jgi:hypothetical protein
MENKVRDFFFGNNDALARHMLLVQQCHPEEKNKKNSPKWGNSPQIVSRLTQWRLALAA